MKDTMVYARYVDLSGNLRWYAIEFDGEDTFFGLVVSRFAAVAGQFTLTELRSIAGEKGAGQEGSVELDEKFVACTVGELADSELTIEEILATPSPREMNLVSGLVDLEE
jgi:hypothetical protein